MKLSDNELPSNKKFGYFFSIIFTLAAGYFFSRSAFNVAYGFTGLVAVLVVVTYFKADALSPLNQLWMKLGLMLGAIISPIVLGIIFFGLFTPIALFMRLIGRDELRIKFKSKTSYWISRGGSIEAESFKHQF